MSPQEEILQQAIIDIGNLKDSEGKYLGLNGIEEILKILEGMEFDTGWG